MHPVTCRTSSDAFVEFPTPDLAAKAMATLRSRIIWLKGKAVVVHESSEAELMRALFPNWDGRVLPGGIFEPGPVEQCPFIDRQHVLTLLAACKTRVDC